MVIVTSEQWQYQQQVYIYHKSACCKTRSVVLTELTPPSFIIIIILVQERMNEQNLFILSPFKLEKNCVRNKYFTLPCMFLCYYYQFAYLTLSIPLNWREKEQKQNYCYLTAPPFLSDRARDNLALRHGTFNNFPFRCFHSTPFNFLVKQ